MKSIMDTEIVTAEQLAPGDLVLRVGRTGAAWCEVADVATHPAPEIPGVVVRVEFADTDTRHYVAGSTFRRRVEDAR